MNVGSTADIATAEALTIQGDGRRWEVALQAGEMRIGRSDSCSVVLKDSRVSRTHARLYQDPFGRWIIEDLGSHNGVWSGGQKVAVAALMPGEAVKIGPFSLTLSGAAGPQRQVDADPAMTVATTGLYDDSRTHLQTRETETGSSLSLASVQLLDEIIEHLSAMTDVQQLYPDICRCLAASAQRAAIVARVPSAEQPLPPRPEVLAYAICGPGGEDLADTAPNLHFSRRVLEAVRTSGRAVLAGGAGDEGDRMDLTVVSEANPRAVLCAPVVETGDSSDVLYLDIPSGQVTSDAMDFVHAVARQVGFAWRALLLAGERAERQSLDRQLAMARDIQTGLIPAAVDPVAGVQVSVHCQPALWVGGDYCDVWPLDDGRLAFAVGDVSGKGLPAAMVMSNLQATLRTTMAFCPDLAEAMAHVDRHLTAHLPDQMFVTIVVGLLDPRSGGLQYVNAGHLLPLVVDVAGEVSTLGEPSRPPLGVIEAEFRASEGQLAPGQTLLVVTDGVTEAATAAGELFGDQRLTELLGSIGSLAADEMTRAVIAGVAEFRGPLAQQDDLTILALRMPAVAQV